MSGVAQHRRVGARRLPMALKLVYTAFVCVLVPVYWHHYGPTNFLYYCDIALLLTGIAVWSESPLLVSMSAVGLLLPQAAWIADFVGGMCGVRLLGLTAYMFDRERPLYLRGLSLFHGWLPLLLIWLVARLGYDRRALPLWTVLAWVLMPLCYFLLPAPGSGATGAKRPVNINYVFGFSDERAQDWMPPLAYLGLLMGGMPALVFYPTHLLLRLAFGARETQPAGRATPSR